MISKYMKSIFMLQSRIKNMLKILPIITTFLMVLSLGFAADQSMCINFVNSDRSESPSENQRESSADEKTGRLAQAPTITRQIKTPIRYLNRFFPHISTQATKSQLSLQGNRPSLDSFCPVFSTNILRI